MPSPCSRNRSDSVRPTMKQTARVTRAMVQWVACLRLVDARRGGLKAAILPTMTFRISEKQDVIYLFTYIYFRILLS